MHQPVSTADRILEAGRKLFNSKGYGETSLSEIAADVGISQGNLTYHFPTKRQLAIRIQQAAQSRAAARRDAFVPGPVAEDYIEHVLSGMDLTWQYRFLFRDRTQFIADQKDNDPNAALVADFKELRALIQRVEEENLFVPDPSRDLDELTRSLWIVSRFWMNFLSEIEGREEINWHDQERGVAQHFAILLPSLTSEAEKTFRTAIAQTRSSRASVLRQ